MGTIIETLDSVTIGQIEAQPLDEMLPKLNEADRVALENFAASVPDPLPNNLAYPVFTFMQTSMSKIDETHILRLVDGSITLEGVIANPGSNAQEANIICLRNGIQTACSPQATVWSIILNPKTLAFVPYEIQAQSGDWLTFLIVADKEPMRLFMASIMQWFFVDKRPPLPAHFVQAPSQARVFPGCDASLILTENPTVAPETLQIPGTQKRGTELYIIFQTCDPVGDNLVQLVPIVDRSRVINMPGEVWNVPLRLSEEMTVIPFDTAALGTAQEFQIAVVPIIGETTESLPDWWGWFPFTPAIYLKD
ncbi:MAG: hypothetical protein KC449_02200 [Anaerolineales bacterium]|nr:hypothetical protein [Anaerolineales bacterium]